jgi:hypothetical protein
MKNDIPVSKKTWINGNKPAKKRRPKMREQIKKWHIFVRGVKAKKRKTNGLKSKPCCIPYANK